MHPPFCSRVELHKGWCSNTPGYLGVPWRFEGCDYHFMPFGKKNLPMFGDQVQAAACAPGFLERVAEKAN